MRPCQELREKNARHVAAEHRLPQPQTERRDQAQDSQQVTAKLIADDCGAPRREQLQSLLSEVTDLCQHSEARGPSVAQLDLAM